MFYNIFTTLTGSIIGFCVSGIFTDSLIHIVEKTTKRQITPYTLINTYIITQFWGLIVGGIIGFNL